jgi:hypothetical protein
MVFRRIARRASQSGTVTSEIAIEPRRFERVVFCCFSAASAEYHQSAFGDLGVV